MYFRPSDRAIDLAIDVLPTPGGPTNRRIGPSGHGPRLDLARVGDRPVFLLLGLAQGRRGRVLVGLELGGRAHARLLDLLGQLPGAKLAHGQELEHPVLDVLEAVVVFVEHLARVVEIELIVGAGVPGELGDPLEVGADDLGLHRFPPGPLQPSQLALDLDARLTGQLELVQLVAQLADLAALVVLTQLLLDGPHLLAEEHLALPFAELFLDLRLDLVLRRQHADLLLDVDQDPAQPFLDAQRLEQGLLLG